MPKNVRAATLASMVDDFSDDEFARSEGDALPTPDSASENRAPGRKSVKSNGATTKTKAPAKTTKAKAAPRRASGASVLGPKKAAVQKKTIVRRAALAEKQANASDTEEVDEFDDEAMPKKPVQAMPPPPKPAKRGRLAKAKVVEESVVEATQPEKKPRGRAAAKTTKAAKRKASPEPAPAQIPETQLEPDPMDVEPSIEIDEVSEQPVQARAAQRSVRQASLQPIASGRSRPIAGIHRRAGSASDTESRTSDPMLRRKLGEMTKKFENIDLKYRNLRELGTQDKETNFDKLKRTTDDRDQDQKNIIAALKRELEEQKALAAETKSLRAEVQTLTDEVETLTSEKKTLSKSLHDSQNENRALTAKLAASRAQSTEPTKTAPGSAVKPRALVPSNSIAANQDLAIRQLKEDLYSDLTGLIVRGIKKVDGEDVYDCIQTGRNGTLHFHLSVASEEEAKAAGENYEDVEFAYTPHLDAQRDRDLVEILPDYLMEEICFPRNNAAKFYAKIVECITRKIVLED